MQAVILEKQRERNGHKLQGRFVPISSEVGPTSCASADYSARFYCFRADPFIHSHRALADCPNRRAV